LSCLGGLLLSAVILLIGSCIRRLDCCGHTSGQPWKRYREYEEVTEVFGCVAEVPVDDRTRNIAYRTKLWEEVHYG
jgi:hypothetical protein